MSGPRCGECKQGRPCWGNPDLVCAMTGGHRRPAGPWDPIARDPEADEWLPLGSWLVAGGVRVDVSEAGTGHLVIRWQEREFFSQVRLPMGELAGLVSRIGWRLTKEDGT